MRITKLFRGRWTLPLFLAVTALLLLGLAEGSVTQQDGDDAILKAEAERVAVIEKVRPAVVAVFAHDRKKGGGSGVLISADGYALTNFHVVAPTGPTMQCGLPDGVLYDAVLVGLDKVGDVALIKLLPKKEGQQFPFAPLGDSDKVREGHWSLAMGNPFLLATDFTPTVTYGLISGVHRYQPPSGILLEYTDCIQIDTSINPGNSGGPLFNMQGELIGINGRGSFDKRARINSGVGYAISINQIKNFLGHLHGGLDSDHASLGALLVSQTDKNGFAKMTVQSILEDSDVFRRGVDVDDEVLSLDGRVLSSVNHFKNVMGLYPRGWRVPLEYRRPDAKAGMKDKEILVRLMGIQRKDLTPGQKPAPPVPPVAGSPAAKFYVAKAGFANYYFNQQQRDRVLEAFGKHGNFAGTGDNWTLEGTINLFKANTPSVFVLKIGKELVEGQGNTPVPVVRLTIESGKKTEYFLAPFNANQDDVLKQPKESGGLLAAMSLYQRLLTQGLKGFESKFDYGGIEPFYPPPTDNSTPKSLKALRLPGDTDVLNTGIGTHLVKWFFDRKDGKLAGFEARLKENEDPCEVYLSDYRAVGGRQVPHRIQVYYGDQANPGRARHYGTLNVTKVTMNP